MPKQLEIAGTERPVIAEIEEAVNEYVKVREQRVRLSESEIAAKTTLIEAIEKNRESLRPDGEGNRTYRFDDLIVILKPGHSSVKVKRDSADEDEADDE